MPTHQEIIDRLEQLGREHGIAYDAEIARQKSERASLQELCGGIGHIYAKNRGLGFLGSTRQCVFCLSLE